MPSVEVLTKMIRRATQIVDPISEINHEELLTDMRDKAIDFKDEIKMKSINN
jgi:hypothetical protein